METSIVCLRDLEVEAKNRLSCDINGYYASGADQEDTLRENREAFNRWYIIPRMLKDVSTRSLTTTVLGCKVSMPIGISPVAMQKMAHPDGECGTARATASMGTIFVASTVATTSLEDIASAAPNAHLWFQLYVFKNRETTRKLLARAEAAGYQAIVLTVDAPICGNRLADVKNKFSMPEHLSMANFDTEESKRQDSTETGSANADYAKRWFNSALTWEDILWLKSITKLPIVVKGILCAEDALLSLEYGASAVMISNHGGRQLNGVPPTIEVLPEVVKAVNGNCEVYFDGGVTQGTDVLKALALGADMVFVGRPAIWGLAYNGEKGVRLALNILKNELDLNMALAGCRNISEISPSLVRRKTSYSRL